MTFFVVAAFAATAAFAFIQMVRMHTEGPDPRLMELIDITKKELALLEQEIGWNKTQIAQAKKFNSDMQKALASK